MERGGRMSENEGELSESEQGMEGKWKFLCNNLVLKVTAL